MANSPLPPRCAPVNVTTTPIITPPADLLRRMLRMIRAALIVERCADQLHVTPGTPEHGQFQHMHNDVYAELHKAVTALAQAQECPASFSRLGENITAFFLAESREYQHALASEISEALAEHATTAGETGTLCGHIRRELAELGRYHRVPHDPLMSPEPVSQ